MEKENPQLFSNDFKDEVNINFSKMENVGFKLNGVSTNMDNLINRENPHDNKQEHKTTLKNHEILKNVKNKLKSIGKVKEIFNKVYIQPRSTVGKKNETYTDSNLCARCFKRTADIEEQIKKKYQTMQKSVVETPRAQPDEHQYFDFNLDERMWDILADHKIFQDDLLNFFKPYSIKELETLIKFSCTEKDNMMQAQEALYEFNNDFELIVTDMTTSLVKIHETISNVVLQLETYTKDAFQSLKGAKTLERKKVQNASACEKNTEDYNNMIDMDHLDVIYNREYKNWGRTISKDASYINSRREVFSERKRSIIASENSQCDEKSIIGNNKNFASQNG